MNCIIVDDDELSTRLLQHMLQQAGSIELLGSFQNPVDALLYLKKNRVDLVFLDIEMPDLNGYELLRNLEDPPMVIVTSSHRDKAVEAFEFDILDFLLKPVTSAAFQRALGRAEKKFINRFKKLPNEIYVRSESKIVRLPYDEIMYVEALADYVTVVTADAKYIVHSTMKGIQERLPEEKFIRIHRSFILNLDAIESIENQFVVSNKRHIPIGASYRDIFLSRLNML